MMDSDVTVVGAGPVGLTMATELARQGVRVHVVDQLAEPRQYAKAVGLQARTLELWERTGLLHEALDELMPMRGQVVYVDGQQVARMDLADLPAGVRDFPYTMASMPQYTTERLLAEALIRLGGAVERAVTVLGFDQDADGVTVRITGPEGERTLRTGFLVGADGAHSVVRKGAGIGFDGDAFSEEYMLGDIEVDWSQPPGFAIRSTRRLPDGSTDLLMAIPLSGQGRYRMSMLAPPELATDPAGAEIAHGLQSASAPELHHLQAVIDRLSPEPTEAHTLRWSSVYRISHRLADRYSSGRVFIAGDAAHIHPPTGAQGMNTGIQDAINLSWKLALVVRGAAAATLLDSYHAERHPIGEEVVGRTTSQARSGGISADPHDPMTMLRREGQLLVAYPESPIVGGDTVGGLRPGDRAPDSRGLRWSVAAEPVRLFSVLDRPEHDLLVYIDADDQLDCLAALADVARAAPMPIRLRPVLAADSALDPLRMPGHVLTDTQGEFATLYGAAGGAGFLVRPDGYLGLVSAPLAADTLANHVRRLAADEGLVAASPR